MEGRNDLPVTCSLGAISGQLNFRRNLNRSCNQIIRRDSVSLNPGASDRHTGSKAFAAAFSLLRLLPRLPRTRHLKSLLVSQLHQHLSQFHESLSQPDIEGLKPSNNATSNTYTKY